MSKDLFEGLDIFGEEEKIELTDIEIVSVKSEVEEEETVEEETVEEEDGGVPDLLSLLNEVDTNIGKNKAKGSKATKGKTASTTVKVPEKKVYKGKRTVKVYGDELFVVEDHTVTEEEIRVRIVEEFGYGEFRKGVTLFDLDEATGILDIGKTFNKKG